MNSAGMVRGLQERAARAFPAEHVQDADGWQLRHAPGGAWWVCAVLPHRGIPLAGSAGYLLAGSGVGRLR